MTDADHINPYFADPEPHPDPSLGCIRRGLCCRTNPGWFAPGEVEKLIDWWNARAEARGEPTLEPRELIRRYLIIDWLEIEGERIAALAPAKLARDGLPLEPPASRATGLYGRLKGRCVFFDDTKGCTIYPARPYECRAYDCTHHPDDNPTHRQIAQMWADAAQTG